jgi:hypothetical protein
MGDADPLDRLLSREYELPDCDEVLEFLLPSPDFVWRILGLGVSSLSVSSWLDGSPSANRFLVGVAMPRIATPRVCEAGGDRSWRRFGCEQLDADDRRRFVAVKRPTSAGVSKSWG